MQQGQSRLCRGSSTGDSNPRTADVVGDVRHQIENLSYLYEHALQTMLLNQAKFFLQPVDILIRKRNHPTEVVDKGHFKLRAGARAPIPGFGS